MKIGLFTEFSYPGKSEQQTYAEVLEQIGVADALGYDFFSITESYGKDLFSCSPFPLGLYVAAAQTARAFVFSPASSACRSPRHAGEPVAAADLLTGGGHGWHRRGHTCVITALGETPPKARRVLKRAWHASSRFSRRLYRKARRAVLADSRFQLSPLRCSSRIRRFTLSGETPPREFRRQVSSRAWCSPVTRYPFVAGSQPDRTYRKSPSPPRARDLGTSAK